MPPKFNVEHDLCNENYCNQRPSKILTFLFCIGNENFGLPAYEENESLLALNRATTFLAGFSVTQCFLSTARRQY